MDWWSGTELPPSVIPIAVICALAGSGVLSLYTRWYGLGTLLFNGVALFIGAMAANLLSLDLYLPLDRYYVRPVVVSFAGMSLISVVVLMWFVRSGNTE